MNYIPKPKFIERFKLLLDDDKDLEKFLEYSKTYPKKSIRVNTLKITPEELLSDLQKKGWKINQPFNDYPEIMQLASTLLPGELGKSKEHIFGYFYVQEITSMMPILALDPKPNEKILDLCASPGSKTTQMAAKMNNTGTIFANDLSIGRISILSANLEKCGVTNTIITRHDATEFCQKIDKLRKGNRLKNFYFDKILVDAPCSGEGNIRLSPRTFLEWSENLLIQMSRKQKKIASEAVKQLKIDGEMVYSTCTHAPEENESVVQYLLDNFDLEIMPISLPLKSRPGISKWKDQMFHKDMKLCHRIYHHDNDMEGFFLCKLKKLSNNSKLKEKIL